MIISQSTAGISIDLTTREYAALIAAARDLDDQLQPPRVSRPIGALLDAHDASPLGSQSAHGRIRRGELTAHGSQLTAHSPDLPLVLTGSGSYSRPWPRAGFNCPLSPDSVAEILGTDDLAAISAEALPLAHG